MAKWQPGQSGNPNGRPKGYDTVQSLARVHTEAAIKTLYEALGDPKTCVAAAVALLDRGWGRPPQQVTVDGQLQHRYIELRVVNIDGRRIADRDPPAVLTVDRAA